jgi:hypothetical protein
MCSVNEQGAAAYRVSDLSTGDRCSTAARVLVEPTGESASRLHKWRPQHDSDGGQIGRERPAKAH